MLRNLTIINLRLWICVSVWRVTVSGSGNKINQRMQTFLSVYVWRHVCKISLKFMDQFVFLCAFPWSAFCKIWMSDREIFMACRNRSLNVSSSVPDPDPYRMFLGPPGSESRIYCTGPTGKKLKKNIDFDCFLTTLWFFVFKEWWKCIFRKEWA